MLFAYNIYIKLHLSLKFLINKITAGKNDKNSRNSILLPG